MQHSEIETLLQTKAGWATETVVRRDIARAVEQRRIACNLPDIDSYYQHVQQFPQELEALIEQLVVPETWFFRDEKPFALLTEYVLKEWLSRQQSTLRLLSLPCSTGEEPYSIAMTLLEAGLSPQRFHIDAIDSPTAPEGQNGNLWTQFL
jgi:chemotaxis protein methyltransferase WspC